MAHDVFISYASPDKPIADAVCATLEARSIRCWIAPRDIMYGADWGEAIVDALGGSRVMVLVFSSNANESPNIKREVDRAVTKGVTIIPLRIEDVAPSRALEYYISPIHWLDALTPPLEGHLNALADKVTILLGKADGDQRPPLPPRRLLLSRRRRLPAAALAGVLLVAGAVGMALWMNPWSGRGRTAGSSPPSQETTQIPTSSATVTPGVPPAPAASAPPAATPPPTSPAPVARAPEGPDVSRGSGVTRDDARRGVSRAPETSARPPEQLRQEILTALKANRLDGLTVEVNSRNNATVTGTVTDGRIAVTAINAARGVRDVRNVAYRFVVKGSRVAPSSSRRVETDSPDILQAQIADFLNRQRLYDLRVEVDRDLNAHMTGTLADYRRVDGALSALSRARGLRSSTYEIVVAGGGDRP